jgi:hypothetical protein
MKIIWKRGFVRLVLVAGILWMLLILAVLSFHVWSCQSSSVFFSGKCFTNIFKSCYSFFVYTHCDSRAYTRLVIR